MKLSLIKKFLLAGAVIMVLLSMIPMRTQVAEENESTTIDESTTDSNGDMQESTKKEPTDSDAMTDDTTITDDTTMNNDNNDMVSDEISMEETTPAQTEEIESYETETGPQEGTMQDLGMDEENMMMFEEDKEPEYQELSDQEMNPSESMNAESMNDEEYTINSEE